MVVQNPHLAFTGERNFYAVGPAGLRTVFILPLHSQHLAYTLEDFVYSHYRQWDTRNRPTVSSICELPIRAMSVIFALLRIISFPILIFKREHNPLSEFQLVDQSHHQHPRLGTVTSVNHKHRQNELLQVFCLQALQNFRSLGEAIDTIDQQAKPNPPISELVQLQVWVDNNFYKFEKRITYYRIIPATV